MHSADSIDKLVVWKVGWLFLLKWWEELHARRAGEKCAQWENSLSSPASHFLSRRAFKDNRTNHYPPAATVSLLWLSQMLREWNVLWGNKRMGLRGTGCIAQSCTPNAWASLLDACVPTGGSRSLDLAGSIVLGACQGFQTSQCSKQQGEAAELLQKDRKL